jgi:hypothetical protein
MAIYEVVTTWAPVRGEGGGWFGSKPAESIASDEPDYENAAMRARMESLLSGVVDVQIMCNGRWAETWRGGACVDGPEQGSER